MKLFCTVILLSQSFLIFAQLPLPLKLNKEAVSIKRSKIKTITTKGKDKKNDTVIYSIKSFNPEGQILKEIHHTGNATTDVYQYNATGMLTLLTKKLKDGAILEKIIFKYLDGFLIEESHQSETNGYTINYQYNQEGQIDTSFIHNKDPQMEVWHYNDNNQLSAVLLFSHLNINGTLQWIQDSREVFYYNKKKLIHKTASCFSRLCFSNVYEYNRKKQLTSISEYQNKDLLGKFLLEYNKKKLISQKSFDTYDSNNAEPVTTILEVFEYTFY